MNSHVRIEEPALLADADSHSTEHSYLRYRSTKALFLVASAVLLLVLGIMSIRLGATGLGYSQIFEYLLFPDGSWNSTVIWSLRLPRIIAAVLGGAALGIAGTVMQCILRNDMASPFTLGVSNAAAFGAALGIVVFSGGSMVGSVEVFSMIADPVIVTASAFVCAMAATMVIIGLVRLTETRAETIVLAGLAVNAIFATGLALLIYIADDVAIASIVFWQFGSLSKASWQNIAVIGGVLAVATFYFYLKRWDYNAMDAGEDVANGLGVRIGSTRLIGLSVSALLTATVVSFFGIIGFIGLVGPHMVKRIIGEDKRYVLAGSMFVGAFILLTSHIVGSHVFGVVIPVGIITSAIGGPTFLAILLRGAKR